MEDMLSALHDYTIYTGKEHTGIYHAGVLDGYDPDGLPPYVESFAPCSTALSAICGLASMTERARQSGEVIVWEIDPLPLMPLEWAIMYAVDLGIPFIETARRDGFLYNGAGETARQVQAWHRVTMNHDPDHPQSWNTLTRYDWQPMTSEQWQDDKIGAVSSQGEGEYSYEQLRRRITETAPYHDGITPDLPVWRIAGDIEIDPDDGIILHNVSGYTMHYGVDKYGHHYSEGSFDPYASCDCDAEDQADCDCGTQECIVCGARRSVGWFSEWGDLVCDKHIVIHCCNDQQTCDHFAFSMDHYGEDLDPMLMDDCPMIAEMRAHGMLKGDHI